MSAADSGKRRLRRGAALLLVAASAAIFFAACRRDAPDWRILQLYSGETSVDLLQHPSKVMAFPLDATGRAPKDGEAHAGPFAAAAPPVDVPADAAAELSGVFFDPDSYDWQRGPRSAPFRPQIGVWFVRGAYVLELAVDLRSNTLAVHAGGQPLGPLTSIAPAAPRLLALAKRLFPDDPAVRALK